MTTTTTTTNIYTDRDNLPEFRITNFSTFTTLEIKSGPSTICYHLGKDISLADVIGAMCKADVRGCS